MLNSQGAQRCVAYQRSARLVFNGEAFQQVEVPAPGWIITTLGSASRRRAMSNASRTASGRGSNRGLVEMRRKAQSVSQVNPTQSRLARSPSSHARAAGCSGASAL
jgi:hypothetical protein